MEKGEAENKIEKEEVPKKATNVEEEYEFSVASIPSAKSAFP